MAQHSVNNRLVSHLVGLERLVELERERDVGLKSLSAVASSENITGQEMSSDFVGGSLEFNGVSTEARVSANIFDGIDISNTGFSIEFWFKYFQNPNAVQATLIGFDSSLDISLYIELGELNCRVLGSDFNVSDIIQDRWYHVVYQHDTVTGGTEASVRLRAEDLSLDIDTGTLSVSSQVSPNQTVNQVLIGSTGFVGFLDEIVIWQGTFPLPTSDPYLEISIDERFNSGEGSYLEEDSRSLLILHLDELTGTVLHDNSGNDNDGELIDGEDYDGPVWSSDGKIPLPDLPIFRTFSGTSIPRWGETTWGGSIWF